MGSCLKIYCRIKAKMELCGDRQKSVAEEKLKFYITSCLFCLCNSACSLKILDHVGYAVLESGGLHQYLELELISLTLVLLFAVAQPGKPASSACPCKGQASPSHLGCCFCVPEALV